MANIKSARKRARQALKRRSRNINLLTSARTAIKNVKKAIAAGDKAAASAALDKSRRIIDSVAAKGAMHRNTASRNKSRLTHAIRGMA